MLVTIRLNEGMLLPLPAPRGSVGHAATLIRNGTKMPADATTPEVGDRLAVVFCFKTSDDVSASAAYSRAVSGVSWLQWAPNCPTRQLGSVPEQKARYGVLFLSRAATGWLYDPEAGGSDYADVAQTSSFAESGDLKGALLSEVLLAKLIGDKD